MKDFMITVRGGKTESGEIIKVHPQCIFIWALRTAFVFLGIVVGAALLSGCAIPIVGAILGAGSATHSAVERNTIEERLDILEKNQADILSKLEITILP